MFSLPFSSSFTPAWPFLFPSLGASCGIAGSRLAMTSGPTPLHSARYLSVSRFGGRLALSVISADELEPVAEINLGRAQQVSKCCLRRRLWFLEAASGFPANPQVSGRIARDGHGVSQWKTLDHVEPETSRNPPRMSEQMLIPRYCQ